MGRKQPKTRMTRDQRQDRRKKKVMSYILVALMVASVAGIWVSSTSNTNSDYSYGDFSFVVHQEPSLNYQYVFSLKGDSSGLYFYTLPQDVLSIETEGNLSEILAPAQMFVLSTDDNPYYLSFYDQVRFELDMYSQKLSISALLNETDNSDFPVITCDNSTIQTPVIELRVSNQTKIVTNPDGCIVIDSRVGDLALVRDRLMYTSLGIIKE